MESAVPNNVEGFKILDFVPPPLTIFALEEPENHLAPFYLPRLIGLLESLLETGTAQSFLTSHSTSVLTRIPPRNVRYFRNDRQTLVSTVKALPLPAEGSEHDNFLHQTILANPEIYFARLVIIGEGDSERIVIPRLAEALGVTLDPSFVAFVPIGGRHAQHLWKVVVGLNIPCLTLLDFDLGRHNGGMGRVRNAVGWLTDVGWPPNLAPPLPENDTLTPDVVLGWVQWLRHRNIFYSAYLDLDMMMIKAFPDAYVASKPYNAENENHAAISKSVFGKSGLGNEELNRIGAPFTTEELYTYKKLFKSRSKPASHYKALAALDKEALVANCPEPLRALIEAAKAILRPPTPPDNGGGA